MAVTSSQRPRVINSIFYEDTITISDIFQYFLTAIYDSHSLILDMIQQFKKIIITSGKTSGKTQ